MTLLHCAVTNEYIELHRQYDWSLHQLWNPKGSGTKGSEYLAIPVSHNWTYFRTLEAPPDACSSRHQEIQQAHLFTYLHLRQCYLILKIISNISWLWYPQLCRKSSDWERYLGYLYSIGGKGTCRSSSEKNPAQRMTRNLKFRTRLIRMLHPDSCLGAEQSQQGKENPPLLYYTYLHPVRPLRLPFIYLSW